MHLSECAAGLAPSDRIARIFYPASSRGDHYHRFTAPGSSVSNGKELAVSKPNIWTVPHGDGWAIRREGSSRVSETFDTKAAAQHAGREAARRDHVEHIIQDRHGRISERNSYGNDPYPPEG